MEKLKFYLSKITSLPKMVLKIGVTLIIVLILSVTAFKKLPAILGWLSFNNPFVTKSEYIETKKSWEKTLKEVDNIKSEVVKRDSIILALTKTKLNLESTIIRNRNILKDARGNIAKLDSIANSVL
jgi:hypothetical protein